MKLLCWELIVDDSDPANVKVYAGFLGDNFELKSDAAGLITLDDLDDGDDLILGTPAEALTIYLGPGFGPDLLTVNSPAIFGMDLNIREMFSLPVGDTSITGALQDWLGGTQVEFRADVSLPGRNLSVAADTIIVAGATISTRAIAGSDQENALSVADSGSLKFEAGEIVLETGTKLLAHVETGSSYGPGDITLAADDSAYKESSLLSPVDFNTNTAKVTIDGAQIRGGNISITAAAEDKAVAEEVGGYGEGFLKNLFDVLDQIPGVIISRITGIMGQVVVHRADATISVGTSTLSGSGSVTVGSSARADASLHTVSVTGQATGGYFTLAFGYGQAFATATTTLTQTSIVAEQAVDITSKAVTNAFVKARTQKASDAKPNPNNVSIALAVANTKETSHVTISEGSSVTSHHEGVNVSATGKVTNSATSQPEVEEDGIAAVAFSLDFDRADIKAVVNGTIDAAGGVGNTFDAREGGAVNYDTNTIRIVNHGFTDGQEVTYSHGQTAGDLGPVEPPDIDGLMDGEHYYVQVLDTDNVRLANAPTIDLDYTVPASAANPQHTLGRLAIMTFASSGINVAGANTIRFASPHGLLAGEAITYFGTYSNPDATGAEQNKGVKPLEQGKTYYVILVAENPYAIQLAESPGGTAVVITDIGVGEHAFLYQTNVVTFAPREAVNATSNTITFTNPHGYNTGDAVLYYTDPTLTRGTSFAPSVFEEGLSVVNSTTLTLQGDQRPAASPNTEVTLLVDGGTALARVLSARYDSGSDLTTIVLDQAVLTGTLARAAFTSPGSITQADTPIEGLSDGFVYYVVNVDDLTIRLAPTKVAAQDAVAIDLEMATDLTNTGLGDAHTLNSSNSPNGILVRAGLDATNTINANSAIQFEEKGKDNPLLEFFGESDRTFLQAESLLGGTGILGTITKWIFSKQPTESPASAGEGSSFGVGGAIAVNYADHDVAATIGATARLTCSKDLGVSAEISQTSQVTSQSGVTKPKDSEYSIAVALGLGIFNNTAKATVESGAQLDATRAISVTSSVTYGFLMSNLLSGINPLDYLKTSGLEGWATFNDGTLGFASNLFNTFVLTSASESKVGIGGSIAINIYNNIADARIKSGALVNQRLENRFRTGPQTVQVNAGIEMNLIGVVGVGGLNLNLKGGIKGFKKAFGKEGDILGGLGELVNPFGAEGDKGGIGASFLLEVITNTTEAVIEGGAKVHTSDLTLDAQTNMFDFSLAEAGGKGSSFAVGGAITVGVVTNITKAHIDSGAIIDCTGPVTISATDDMTKIGITGGVVAGENKGVGVSVSVNVINRNTQAFVGNDLLQNAGQAGTNITAGGAITLTAKSTGALWTAAVAAAVITDKPPTEKEVTDNELIKKAPSKAKAVLGETGESSELKVGVGIAGDVSVNILTEKTYAYINDQGIIHADGQLKLSSTGDSAIWSLAGSVALSLKGEKNSKGIAGSISVNVITSDTKAFVSGAGLTAGSLSLTAERKGGVRSLTAAGSGAPLKAGIAFAGSISVNVVIDTVEAYLVAVTATSTGATSVIAKNECQIWAIGGAVAYGGKGGVGIGIAVNIMKGVTRACIADSTVTIPGGTLEVSALNDNPTWDPRIIAITGSLGIGGGSESWSGAGTISVNIIWNETETNKTEACIKNSTITETPDNPGTVHTWVKARDNSGITAISGAVGIANQTSIGAAISYNEIHSDVVAYLDKVSLTTSGSLTVDAATKSVITSVTIGVGAAVGTAKLAGAGSVSINVIENTVDAAIRNGSTVTIGGPLVLMAHDDSSITGDAGGFAIALGSGGKKGGAIVAVGLSIVVNDIENTIKASLDAATVQAGSVEVTAESTAVVDGWSIGGALAAGGSSKGSSVAVAGGGAWSSSTIETIIEAFVTTGSSVMATAGAVAVNARDNRPLFTTGTQFIADLDNGVLPDGLRQAFAAHNVALSTSAKVVVLIAGQEWIIQDSGATYVIRKGPAGLIVLKPSIINTDAGGFAVAVGFSSKSWGPALSIGAAIADNDIANQIRAYLGSPTAAGATPTPVNATGGVSLNATSAAVIDALTIGVAVGAAASTKGAGLGGSVAGALAYNKIANTIEAFIRAVGTFGIAGGDLSLTATDSASITADAIGVAVAVGASTSSFGGSLAVGVSIAQNEIDNQVRAYIDNTPLAAPQNKILLPTSGVRLSAVSTGTITAHSVAASVALGAGKTGGLALSGGGAVSWNAILTDTNAYLKGVDLVSAGDVTLEASNTSAIEADVDAWAISLGFGLQTFGAAASIGASIALNHIGYDLDGNRSPAQVQAYVENSSINAQGGLAQTAVANETINATITAGSVAVAGGGKVGIGLSGSGADARNRIATQVKTYINGDGPAGIAADSVTLWADDISKITADVEAVAVAVSFAPTAAVSLSIGVSLARNEIYNEVESYITSADSVMARHGPVSLRAIENAAIDADSWAVAVSAAVSQAGIALSGGGANATNMIANRVHAYIAASSVTTNLWDYTTQDRPNELLRGDRVRLDNGDIVEYIGADRLDPDGTLPPANLGAEVYTGTGAPWKLVNRSDAVAFDYTTQDQPNDLLSGDRVRLDNGDIVEYIGAARLDPDGTLSPVNLAAQTYTDGTLWKLINNSHVIVAAQSTSSITATVWAASVAVGVGSGLGAAVAIGVTIAENHIGSETPYANEVLAYIDNSTVTSACDIRVSAFSQETIASKSVAASAAVAASPGFGLAGAGAGTGTWNLISTTVHAYLRNTDATAAGDICVTARSSSEVTKSTATGVAVALSLAPQGVAISVAASTVDNTIENDVQAYVAGTDAGTRVAAGGDISILADVSARVDEVNAVTASVSAGLIGLSGGGIDISNTIENTIAAYIDGPLQVAAEGDVEVVARENAYLSADATAVSVSISFGAAVGVALVKNEIASTIQAWIADATVTSSNTLVQADSIANIPTTATAGISGSAVGVQVNEGNAIIKTLVRAYVENATLLSRGDITISATANNTAKASGWGGAFGAIAVGVQLASVNLGRGVGVDEVEAAVGAGTTVVARALRIIAAEHGYASRGEYRGRRRGCRRRRRRIACDERQRHPGSDRGRLLGGYLGLGLWNRPDRVCHGPRVEHRG